jgi:hypothetical protein
MRVTINDRTLRTEVMRRPGSVNQNGYLPL